ncbi:MAG: lamin tail domain-containing protein [Thermomicrobiales bacterium]
MKNWLAIGILALLLAISANAVMAAPPGNRHFENTWERTDRPVAEQQVSRTWMWGPGAITGILNEPYADAPGLYRTVQYYDKSRMEITYPGDDPSSIWYVTNGLLAQELITGRMQLGDSTWEQYDPAEVNVAGDADDPNGPTYDSFQRAGQPPLGFPEDPLITRISRDGTLTDDLSLAGQGIFASYYVIETNHRVAEPFWRFMNSSGPVYSEGSLTTAPLFSDPFFATGFPISEGYWANVKVGGQQRDVLIQCFERRCLTYTPGNPSGFEVEAGNIGQHYYEWRYVINGFELDPQPYPDDGDLRVTAVLADPVDYGEDEGEWVEVTNFDDTPISMAGWRIEDAAGNGYDFPPSFVLWHDATVRLHICNGTDSETASTGDAARPSGTTPATSPG